jgi:hypothetical protein
MVKYSWKKTQRIRDVNETRDAAFPAFRRTDAKNWKLYWFVFWCWLAPLRLVNGFFWLLSPMLWSWIVRIGHDETQPLTGIRKSLMKCYFSTCCQGILLTHFIKVDYDYKDDYDYSYYLGPDYKKTQKLPKNIPTIVAAPH